MRKIIKPFIIPKYEVKETQRKGKIKNIFLIDSRLAKDGE